MKAIPLLLLFFVFPSFANANLNCNDLVGMWSSERHDATLSSDRRTIKSLNSDGSYWIKFIHDDGNGITIQEEHGSWSCNGNELSIEINKIDENSVSFLSAYNLLTLRPSFHSISPIAPNCANVLGDCGPDLVLEYFRVLN